LETALNAASDRLDASLPKVLILSGTGSCCYGTLPGGSALKVGGWGHLLGDKGSGYEIGLRGIKAAIYHFDQTGVWPRLGQRILRTLQFNEPNDLISWAQAASKPEIASLALEVLAAWRDNDKIATGILAAAAESLARDAATCANRLLSADRKRIHSSVQFILGGSILLKQPNFAAWVCRELKKLWPNARITPLAREGVWGAIALARQLVSTVSATVNAPKAQSLNRKLRGNRRAHADQPLAISRPVRCEVTSSQLSPTEQRHPASMKLDRMALDDAVVLMLGEDSKVPKELLKHRRAIVQTIQAIVRAFKRGGRLIYVGAGTSGRLGVLDASECPPTFRAPPEQVQAIIAGGQTAIWTSVEGAEDDMSAGQRAIAFRNVKALDVVVGLAASGTTPFVWGALGEAKRRGATTALICFNPFLQIPPALRPKIVLAPNLDPELLTGSTRLKSGTATKLLLNIFTTLAMVRTGKVISNLMVDLLPANRKLRDRATRIVQQLTGADYVSAQSALKRNKWLIKKAVVRLPRTRAAPGAQTFPADTSNS
jgi:N-acetylmuramic acid 6-phosphate etherase